MHIAAPDLTPWLPGNAGIPGVWRFAAAAKGPQVVITSLIHGNEIAGAVAITRLLAAPPRLQRGALTLVFANLDAFARFDTANPTASRFADEDMNRLWEPDVLDGPRVSRELVRARVLRPIIEQADIVLDLHSMLWPSEPLMLCGPTAKGRALAEAIGTPDLVIADHGHVSGPRLIDYERFTGPGPAAAVLVEAGQHWEAATVHCARASLEGVLAATGLLPRARPSRTVRFAEVTRAVTASTAAFAFLRPFRGGEVIPDRNTLIALDGTEEIRTPHDQCMLVMPSLRPSRGHTAVRLARLE